MTRTSPGHRRRCVRDDQRKPAGLHHHLRCGDIDGVVFEQRRENDASLSRQASSSMASSSSGQVALADMADTRRPDCVARPAAWCDRSRPHPVLGDQGQRRRRVTAWLAHPKCCLDSAWCDHLQDAQLSFSGIPERMPVPARLEHDVARRWRSPPRRLGRRQAGLRGRCCISSTSADSGGLMALVEQILPPRMLAVPRTTWLRAATPSTRHQDS